MGSHVVDQALEQELRAAARDVACELLHVAFKGGVLQVVLDHPDGVTLEHCEAVSKQASTLLDTEDFGADRYVLEVTSPGLDRQLFGPDDYRRFAGHRVRVTHFATEGGRKATVVGELAAFDESAGDAIRVVEETGVEHRIPLSEIKLARLVPEL